jgi:thioredoxin reductase (NADPH)
MDYDAIVVGGGPAGLTAARELAQAEYRVLLLERESFGGRLMTLEQVENCPGVDHSLPGPKLGAKMTDQAAACGVELKQGEVVEIESYADCKSVNCADGASYTASAVVVASGLRYKKLGVANEGRLEGMGVIHCAFCDGSLYSGREVVVCGGGNAGVVEALHLARFASKVHLIEMQPDLTADASLKERARDEQKLSIRCGARAVDILGSQGVTGVQIEDVASGTRQTLDAYGVLVHVGFEPATDFLEFVIQRDDEGFVETSGGAEAEVPGIILAGDVMRGSRRNVANAIDDGVNAALSAKSYLSAR